MPRVCGEGLHILSSWATFVYIIILDGEAYDC